jgi:Asp-tRNA(Asn)/Glu-tRNA(Gln) amidotransferase A subunit family amidase
MVLGARTATAADYARAVRTIHAAGRAVESFFARHDVLLTPTMATPPVAIGELALANAPSAEYIARIQAATGYTQLFNAGGQPAMSVPLGQASDGLPLGVQFAARFGDEATLFRLAGQLEQAQPWRDRRPPVAQR